MIITIGLPVGGIRDCLASYQSRIKKESTPVCSVPSPDKGTSNRICYGVGTDRILPNPDPSPFSGYAREAT
ncbi:hypothetical protein L0N23_11000 [Bacteroides intestinalis]|uniref:hypothetical protein n=1 Tax=Bacteroides intestinalis TaxID=329854 RepID=UPI0011C391EC|nr:hypothetical protein [Bacteroides intestinalis]MCB6676581.1 hypothetical protein [Bacteroides intestinalis]MCB7014359.1 hypothetical protein [Bacteroides intestinalis]MCG4701519.1 hypothetical protein [Bacteroides intestinalis]MCG4720016.1 hypothetical protein [Bacteroides intestinalis]MCG4737445.1 hypothetical protein [Bacteroides intestinalis]